jgi:hypothetical protein
MDAFYGLKGLDYWAGVRLFVQDAFSGKTPEP